LLMASCAVQVLRRWRVSCQQSEAALDANFSADAIADGTVSADGLMSDIHASAEYRAHLIGEMTRRAVTACG